jgi:hypothetical protein
MLLRPISRAGHETGTLMLVSGLPHFNLPPGCDSLRATAIASVMPL